MISKTINADNNTLSNIANAQIKTGAGVDCLKLSSGLVSNTNFNYLSNLNQYLSTSSTPTFSSLTIRDINDTNNITFYCPWNLSGDSAVSIPQGLQGLDDALVLCTIAQTLTNKSIDADLNTITNIK